MSDDEQADRPGGEPIGGCFLRLFWAMAGPPMAGAIVLVTGLGGAPLPSAGDYLYVTALAALIGARVLDGRHGTVDRGSADVSATSPAKYVAAVAAFGALLFVAVRVVAPRVL